MNVLAKYILFVNVLAQICFNRKYTGQCDVLYFKTVTVMYFILMHIYVLHYY